MFCTAHLYIFFLNYYFYVLLSNPFIEYFIELVGAFQQISNSSTVE